MGPSTVGRPARARRRRGSIVAYDERARMRSSFLACGCRRDIDKELIFTGRMQGHAFNALVIDTAGSQVPEAHVRQFVGHDLLDALVGLSALIHIAFPASH